VTFFLDDFFRLTDFFKLVDFFGLVDFFLDFDVFFLLLLLALFLMIFAVKGESSLLLVDRVNSLLSPVESEPWVNVLLNFQKISFGFIFSLASKYSFNDTA